MDDKEEIKQLKERIAELEKQLTEAREYGERMHQLLIETRKKYNLPEA